MTQTFRREDLELILAGAAALQTRDASKISLDELNGIARDENGDYPLSVAYDVAEALLVPREYVDRYLKIRFPSNEAQIEMLKIWKATPTLSVIKKDYLSTLANKLADSLTLERFGNSPSDGEIYRLKSERSGFFRDKFTKEILATLENSGWPEFNNLILNLHVKSPFFLGICSETITKLNEKYSHVLKGFRVHYEYVA